MAAPHTFLDILANPQVRDAYLAGRITLILSADLKTILWANGAGARFMGFHKVADSINVESGFDRQACNQIKTGLDSLQPISLAGVPLTGDFLVNTITIEQLGEVVFLRSVSAVAGTGGAVDLTDGLDDETTEAAVLDLSGQVMRASPGFNPDLFDTGELAALLQEAQYDGGVKKRFLAKNSKMPVGVLQLCMNPAIFLLIAAKPDAGQTNRKGLSPQEREAFSVIARQLKADIFAAGQTPPPTPAIAAPAALSPIVLPPPGMTPPHGNDADYKPQAQAPAAQTLADKLDRQGNLAPGMPLLLEQLPLAVVIHREDTVLFANQAFLALTGYPSVDAFQQAEVPATMIEAWSMHHAVFTASGMEVPVNAQRHPVVWQDGRSAVMVSLAPVEAPLPETGKAEADKAEIEVLKYKTIELSALLNIISDGIIILDSAGIVSSANEAACRIFGYPATQMKGQLFSRFFAEKSLETARLSFQSAKQNGHRLAAGEGREVEGLSAHGETLKLRINFGRMELDEGYFLMVRDLTRFHTIIAGLLRNQYQAEEVSKRKSRYLALVSHEIRTPLNAVIGLSQLMLAGKYGPLANERYRNYLDDIVRSGQHIMTLVNDLLQASKSEEDWIKLDIRPVSLISVLNEVLGLMMPQANANRIIIRSGIPADLPMITADARSVRQIFLNLLSNAIRFTPQGGQIILSAYHHQPDAVLLRIRDTGIGMTSAEMHEALKPYRQIGHNNAPAGGGETGTGLGLPLTKALAEANHARFALHSEVGKGTVAELVFRTVEQSAATAS